MNRWLAVFLAAAVASATAFAVDNGRAPVRLAQVLPDAAQDAQTPRNPPATRPEQKKSAHDQADVFAAQSQSTADQDKEGV